MTQLEVARPAPVAPVTGSNLAMFPGQGSQRAGMAAHLLQSYADITAPIFAAPTTPPVSGSPSCAYPVRKRS